jgi:hypothetical protein
MNKNRTHIIAAHFYYILILISAFIISSCHTKTKIIIDAKKVEIAPEQLPKDDSKTAIQLTKLIKQNEFVFKTLSAKIDADLNINEEKNSFVATVRIKKDSAIWASISPALGIEAARAIITRDSVVLIDRINHKYIAGNYSYLNKLLNTELDYDMIEDLLVGNAIDYYDDERLSVSKDIQNKQFILSSIKKRKLKRVMKDAIVSEEPIESLWIIPEMYKVSKIYLDDFINKRSFMVSFDSYNQIDSVQMMPTKANYEIKAQKNIFLDLNYNKISINEPLELPFRIPDRYAPMKSEDE